MGQNHSKPMKLWYVREETIHKPDDCSPKTAMYFRVLTHSHLRNSADLCQAGRKPEKTCPSAAGHEKCRELHSDVPLNIPKAWRNEFLKFEAFFAWDIHANLQYVERNIS